MHPQILAGSSRSAELLSVLFASASGVGAPAVAVGQFARETVSDILVSPQLGSAVIQVPVPAAADLFIAILQRKLRRFFTQETLPGNGLSRSAAISCLRDDLNARIAPQSVGCSGLTHR